MLNALVLTCPFALSPDLLTLQTAAEIEVQSEFSCKLLAQIRVSHVETHFESR